MIIPAMLLYLYQRMNDTEVPCSFPNSQSFTSKNSRGVYSPLYVYTNKRNVLRDTIYEQSVQLPGRELNQWSLIYIDDMNIGEVHAMEQSKSTYSQYKEERLVHARYCESKFKEINEEATKVGMVINASKTQLLCCLLYTSPSPRDLSTSRMPSSA